MADSWKSSKLYEHPARHQAGVFGIVVLSSAGVYCFRVGGSMMSCPQDWATKIHHDEGNENLSIRGIDRKIWKHFKAKCATLGIPVGKRINQILLKDINDLPCIEKE